MSLINQVLQDLEKRHASEFELKTLPPFVRAAQGRPHSFMWKFAIMAIVAVILIAVAAFIYNRISAPGNEAPRIAATPVTLPSQPPAPKPPIAAPAVEVAAQTPAFNPVSRLSDELSFVAPPPVPKEKPVATARSPKADVAIPLREVAPAPLSSQIEKPRVPAVEAPPKSDVPSKPTPAAEPALPLSPEPIAAADGTPGAIDKQMREVAPYERAEIAFRKGVAQIQEGRANAAELEFRDALKQDPSHIGARQALLGLFLDSGRNNEAEQLLRKTLAVNPRQPRHAMVLARLEVERGDVTSAINTMVGVLPYVKTDPDFHAFLAALLQREGRHREAVDYYRAALRGTPGNGVWMMGLAISLRASNQSAEAQDAFQRAIESKQLSPELQEFVERQLRELSAPKKK